MSTARIAMAVAAGLSIAAGALAQSYPVKAVRVIKAAGIEPQ